MNSAGVTKALPDTENHSVAVTYDDEKTSLKNLIKALKEGEAQFID